MKILHILIVLVIAALALGCIGNKQAETKSAGTTVQPAQTTVSPAVPGVDDPFGTDVDVATLDSMLADSTMDISLMDSI
ncbi:MAG: hypothetical protein PHH85_09550 [Candidatus Methanoperedens sp.]|nr:hypothetical protein [Candidatus Methanoperedens sp.]